MSERNFSRRGLAAFGAMGLLVSLGLVACGGTGDESSRAVGSTQQALESDLSLADLAAKKGLVFGAAIDGPSMNSPSLAQPLMTAFKYHADMTVSMGAMKFGPLQPAFHASGSPANTGFTFERADDTMEFAAAANHLLVRGHTPVWHAANPAWLDQRELDCKSSRAKCANGTSVSTALGGPCYEAPDNQAACTKAVFEELLKTHIQTVFTRYKGGIQSWDVVNEAILESEAGRVFDGFEGLRNTIWRRTMGGSFVPLAFKLAHDADPNAQLCYNEFDLEVSPEKRRLVLALLRTLRAQNAPIHCLGTQSHLNYRGFGERFLERANLDDLKAFLQEVKKLGLWVQITELDVRNSLGSSDPNGSTVPPEDVAWMYKAYLDVVLQDENVRGIVTWGLTAEQRDPDMIRYLPMSLGTEAGVLTLKLNGAGYAMVDALNAAPPRDPCVASLPTTYTRAAFSADRAVTGCADGNLYLTTAARATEPTWIKLGKTSAAATPVPLRPVNSIAIRPNDAKQMYAAFASSAPTPSLWKTVDTGNTWTALTPPIEPVWNVSLNPNNPEIVYVVGPTGVAMSGNGGQSWATSATSGPLNVPLAPGASLSAVLVESYDKNKVWVGATNGDLFYSSQASLGTGWTNLKASNMPSRRITSLTFANGSIYVAYNGLGTNSLWRRSAGAWTNVHNAGLPTTGTPTGGKGLFGLGVSTLNPNLVHVVGADGFGRSEDGGQTWIWVRR
ncbi:MAG: endo-1,4-beta-xylanase [Myxococcota bacterium]